MTADKNPNLAEEIFADLERRILSGELAAGDRLPAERELSTAYDTNRNTLREAIRKLEQARLVTVRHGQGVTVADFRRTATIDVMGPFFEHAPDAREKARVLLDLLPARVRLIEFATHLATERANAADIARLRDLAELVIAADEKNDDAAVALGVQRWVDALVDAAHSLPVRWLANPLLEAERAMFQRLPALYLREPTLPAFLRGVVSAVGEGDRQKAIAATRVYFGGIDAKLVSILHEMFGEGPAPRAERKRTDVPRH
jgi:GntR family transcriptional regulator, transcriptional repressor for pyruvate dehydrogenase complex